MDHKNEEIKRLQVLVDMWENEDVINSSTEKSINKMKRRIELLQARVIQLLTSQNKSNYKSTKMQTVTRYFDHSQVQTDGPGQIAYSKSVKCQTKEVDRFSRTFINMVDGQSKFKVYKQKDSTC